MIDLDDDAIDYNSFTSFISDDINRQKNFFIKSIENNGNDLINEVTKNNKIREKKRNNYISYIKRKSKNEILIEELELLNDKDLKILYDKIVYENRSFLKKIIEIFYLNNENS